jgi:NTP pyrophosphatase (non-canonical NTP hydrolase)
MTTGLTFSVLRQANLARLPLFKNARGEVVHPPDGSNDWSASQWLQAVIGEIGEYANLQKKIERGDFGLSGAIQKRQDLADELADVVCYLDHLAACLRIDLGVAVTSKFNRVSDRVKAPVHIGRTLPGQPLQVILTLPNTLPEVPPPQEYRP